MRHGYWAVGLAVLMCGFESERARGDEQPQTYEQLLQAFQQPDHARYGEVPLWWWEGDRLTKERVTWELETLAAQGVRSVCPIQRSPARCDPASFTPQWWEMFEFVHSECRRLGMTLWAYDQIGYGHYGWLEKAAAQTQDDRTMRVVFLQADADPDSPVSLELPDGKLLAARGYPLIDGVADDGQSVDLSADVNAGELRWTPSHGSWRVAVSVTVPETIFQLSDRATDTFLDMLYGEVERRLGRDAMGRSFVGMFQDEHPSTPRDVYTARLAELFQQRCGYDIARAIPALHFDVGPLTPKYRTDYFDTYLLEDERCYWRRVFEWAESRGLLTSYDNWGRQDLVQQSFGYIDYFRTQRWFTAPGYDDAGQAPLTQRNYYDTKIASSLARLYQRPRVWAEVFHSSGWGRTTDQTLSWLSANYAFGANLYDEHGLYYSARAATWEHAAPDPHWRQPYWRYYGTLSDWVARMSFVMSQGTHVTDVAVHYPVASLLAGELPGRATPDYNHYMRLSRKIYDAGIDNDIIDDESIVRAEVADGKLTVAGNSYQALVFGPQTTMRRAVLEKALALAESGGCVVFCGPLPSASTESGNGDARLTQLLTKLLAERPQVEQPPAPHKHRFAQGGCAAWIHADDEQLVTIVDRAIQRDFQPVEPAPVFVSHRRIGEADVYLVQNASAEPIDLEARFRAVGTPRLWDAFTGETSDVDQFEPAGSHTLIRHRLEGNVAQLIVFRPEQRAGPASPKRLLQPDELVRALDTDWTFSVIPTRDNRWGEFRWPPSDELIGPEIRSFRYALETPGAGGEAAGWQQSEFDDSQWSQAKYSIGPYWLCLPDVKPDLAMETLLEADGDAFEPGREVTWDDNVYTWQTVEFSQTIGLARPAPWGGHSGYPDGAIDQNFVDLPEGRKLLFTRLHVPREQRRGLCVQLRQSAARLWVNGVEQPIEGAVGNLPLRDGYNTVLLELADGGHGMLYVQADPPSRSTLDEAGAGDREPPFADAKWIQVPGAASGYFRKTFELSDAPREARVVVTGYTGYRLFVNGKQVEEDIGPWAKWTDPETVNIAPYLRAGRNVIAAWVQVLFDQNVRGEVSDQALALALRVELPDGQAVSLVTDETWLGSEREVADWQTIDFDDSDWAGVKVLGGMGVEPYGSAPLENVGAVTEPRRRLAIDLPSPNITCFEEVPEVIYDVFAATTQPVGWYRFQAPPGLRQLELGTLAESRVWVDGKEVAVQDGIAQVATPPRGVSRVAVRMVLPRGAYGGAALPQPIAVELQGGIIEPGLWADFALPTYAGIGVYQQTLQLTEQEAGRPTELDLGNVLVAAELLVNGQSVGVRLARPFRFDVSDFLQPGDNLLEVRVANTLAPHYLQTNESTNLGPSDSGLLGPVTLHQQLPREDWLSWAQEEVGRLKSLLAASTDELKTAQRQWESQYHWTEIVPRQLTSEAGNTLHAFPDHSVFVEGPQSDSDAYEVEFDVRETGITGIRLEALPHARLPEGGPGRGPRGEFAVQDVELTASLPDDASLRGRTVRVQLLDKTEFLHMAEVQVFRGDVNLATQGTARQSSTSLGAAADRAIDGNTDGSWPGNSVTHTNSEHEPWWEVDLGSMRLVNRIVIWNRTDGQLETRLDRFRVSLLDDRGNVVWEQIVTDPPDPHCELYLSPQPVELVRVPKDGRPVGSGATGEHAENASDALWSGPVKADQRDIALFETRPKFGFPMGTRLLLRLEQRDGTLGRFRVAVTTMPTPLRDVPSETADILKIEQGKRSSQQAEQLAAFFRSIAPQLAPARQRLSRLQLQIRQVQQAADR